ncbi:MAG: hypothetical protein ACM3X6_01365 [Patescibacteria group bacterium]
MSGKIKTTSRERADSYVEGQEYLFKFPQDNELGGVFAASERQAGQDQEETPEQAEARFADYAARVARDMHEKDPGLPLEELIGQVAIAVWPVKGSVEERIEKARPHVVRALAGVREDAFAALVELETFAALEDIVDEASQLTDDELVAKVLPAMSSACSTENTEAAQDELQARVQPLVMDAKARFADHQWRQTIRETAEELLAGADPRPEIDDLVETILADGDVFIDEPTDEQRAQVRQEVELIYARLDAITVGEEHTEAPAGDAADQEEEPAAATGTEDF